ncbi:MAG: hypothetical protein IKS98_07395 [Lachnospiraceae bacterium]|nr:hypothetical protein [Lachnospiraceae bacterium]
MNYNFDWNIVSEGAPYVTISKLGIAFNMASIKKLGSPEYVMLGFDADQMVIGVKAAVEIHDGDKNVYSFKERIKNNWVRIGCKDFVKYLEKLSALSFAKAIRYIADFDSENLLLIIKVTEEGDDEDADDCE